jgi:hypothetical protein
MTPDLAQAAPSDRRLAGRGAALVGEMFNSNTINLAVDVIAPSLFVTFTGGCPVVRRSL